MPYEEFFFFFFNCPRLLHILLLTVYIHNNRYFNKARNFNDRTFHKLKNSLIGGNKFQKRLTSAGKQFKKTYKPLILLNNRINNTVTNSAINIFTLLLSDLSIIFWADRYTQRTHEGATMVSSEWRNFLNLCL